MTKETEPLRNQGTGRYTRSIDTAERDAECARLRTGGVKLADIASQLGYANAGGVSKAISRAMLATVQEAGEEAKQLELERLDSYIVMALEVAHRTHYAHSQGRVVMMNDEPLIDDGPILAALDRLIKLSERRSKLKGLDAPLRHEVVSMDATEAAIAQLEAELGRNNDVRTL
jgi:hypothetical protein